MLKAPVAGRYDERGEAVAAVHLGVHPALAVPVMKLNFVGELPGRRMTEVDLQEERIEASVAGRHSRESVRVEYLRAPFRCRTSDLVLVTAEQLRQPELKG